LDNHSCLPGKHGWHRTVNKLGQPVSNNWTITAVYLVNMAGIEQLTNWVSQFPTTGQSQLNSITERQSSIIDLVKNFSQQLLYSRRFPVFPEGISNSSRFPVLPGFPEVVEIL